MAETKTTSAAKGKAPEAAAAKAKVSAKPEAKAKAVKPPKAGDKPNALQQPLQPSAELAKVVGAGTMPRGEVVSKVWAYIKAHKLQDPDDGRQIVPDATLKAVLGRDKVSMFEMNKMLAQHLK